MGIFDQLTNLSPEQNQGLLAAAAQMLQQSGPSRMPTSLGQILGGGLQAYQGGVSEAQKRKLEELLGQQATQMNANKLRDAESDFQNQEAQRARAEQLRQFYMQQGGTTGGVPSAAIAGAPPAAPLAAPAGGANGGIYQQRLAMAQQLRNAGFSQEADAQEAAALKFQPKVKNWSEVRQGGRVLYAPFYEDGTSGQPVPLEVAKQLEFRDSGGGIEALDAYSGNTVRTIKKTQSPDSIASTALSRERLNFDRGQVGKPVFSAEAGGFVLPPSAANPSGKLVPVSGIPGKAPTEFQGKSAAFGLRATEANKILSGLEGKGVTNTGVLKSVAQGAAELVPFVGDKLGSAVGSGFNTLPGMLGGPSEQQQQVEQARRDFVNAVLRQESGAAIGQTEFENAAKQYFPQPGDTANVIAQKRRNRELAIQGLQTNAGRAAMTAPAKSGAWGIQKVSD